VLTILPPAVAAGALFPALCARHPGAAAGERTSRVLAAHTAGTLVGPLLTALMLVPWLGIVGAALALTATVALAGVAVLLRHPRRASTRARVGALGAVALFALAATTTPPSLTQQILARKIGPAHLSFEHYEEGRSATVAVVRNQINGERQLFVNGINEVTTRLVHDQSFALLGHIGPLLHPDPKRVGVICLGAGLSAGAAARHPLDVLTIVDLEPAVEGGARRFEAMNYAVLDDPRTTLMIDDGRAHLRTLEEPYDVVVLDSTHPRAVDSWILYTREFYRLAKEALADDGILVQWLPLHGLSVDEFRILVGTFRETFTDATMWTNVGFEPYGQVAYAQLVGSRRGDLSVDAEALARRLEDERVHASLEPWGLGSAAEILECLHAGPETLARWSEGLPVNTDDHPLSQFVTRYTASAPMTPDRLLEAFEPERAPYAPPLPEPLAVELERRWEAQGLLLARRLARASEVCGPGCAKLPMFAEAMATGPGYYRALAERYPADPDRSLEVARGLASHGLGAEALALLEEAARAAPGDFELVLHLGLLRATGGDAEGAAAAHREAVAIDPERALGHLNLGLARLAQGQVGRALVSLERAVELDPELAAAHAGLGYALMHRRNAGERPEQVLREALRLDPRHRDARANLGQLLLRRGRPGEAVRVLRLAYRYHPYDADLLFDLALARREAGAPEAARRDLARVLAIDPNDNEARTILVELTSE
jgi:spermidine synthase/tetratricopeptide (TPR) repeat protein